MKTNLRISLIAMALAAPLVAFAAASGGKGATPAYVTAAINDAARKDDAADDARRKLAEVMTFAEVKPGQKVAELVPGQGYWTKVFSGIVGPSGQVYTVWPNEMDKYSAESFKKWQDLSTKAPYTNVKLLHQAAAKLDLPESVDLVFTVQNYHDYHDKFMGPVDMASFNKQVFSALKPGGLYVIVDHVAPAGSGFADTDTTHRVDPEAVKKEVEAAGFKFEGSSDALRNPDDKHEVGVFDKSIRGHTDQFIYKFRKPAH
ncbi:MAG TPA: class I SAM-dependent methyltransferase [Gammaproteobacteria bacterium]|jgi:predicted methyltransferase|nr:class I SAM-dependent methyltransferase [Gammaproteobacteria bacterium]